MEPIFRCLVENLPASYWMIQGLLLLQFILCKWSYFSAKCQWKRTCCYFDFDWLPHSQWPRDFLHPQLVILLVGSLGTGLSHKSSSAPCCSEAVGMQSATVLSFAILPHGSEVCVHSLWHLAMGSFTVLAYVVSNYDRPSAGWFYPALPYFHAYKLHLL